MCPPVLLASAAPWSGHHHHVPPSGCFAYRCCSPCSPHECLVVSVIPFFLTNSCNYLPHNFHHYRKYMSLSQSSSSCMLIPESSPPADFAHPLNKTSEGSDKAVHFAKVNTTKIHDGQLRKEQPVICGLPLPKEPALISSTHSKALQADV